MELGDVTQHNLKQLRKLNSVIFPVSYSDRVSSTCDSYVLYFKAYYVCLCYFLNAYMSKIIDSVSWPDIRQ